MRILFVEDDAAMACALRATLEKHAFVLDVVGSLSEAEAALKIGQHGLLLLDRNLPDGDGATFVPRARAICPNLPIIVLTAMQTVADRVAGLDFGADDYLTKPFATEELLARMRAISRRPTTLSMPVLSVGNLSFDFATREASVGGRVLRLPRRQLLVLEALALRQGRTVTKSSLLEAVYGFDDEIQSNSLEAHVSRLRRALGDAGAGVEIHVMRGLGYLLQEK